MCGLKLAYDPPSEHRLDVRKYWQCWKENHRVRCCDRGCEYLWKYVAHPTLPKISYLLFIHHHLAWGSQIYQASDSPDYRRGNTANVAISGCTILLWLAQKAYYKYKNVQRQKALASLDENERRAEELQAETLGNQSILYKFSS